MQSVLKGQAEMIYKNEVLKEPWYRLLIVGGQVGQLCRFFYRSNDLKKQLVGEEVASKEKVREAGTIGDEEIKIGEAILQIAVYAVSRGLDLDRGLNEAFDKIYHKDWKLEQANGDPICAVAGLAVGKVLFIGSEADILQKLEGRTSGPVIVVFKTTEPDIVHRTILNEWVSGVICSVGGKTSHPAINARTRGIACVMNYTPDLAEGERIQLTVSDKVEIVKL